MFKEDLNHTHLAIKTKNCTEFNEPNCIKNIINDVPWNQIFSLQKLQGDMVSFVAIHNYNYANIIFKLDESLQNYNRTFESKLCWPLHINWAQSNIKWEQRIFKFSEESRETCSYLKLLTILTMDN